MSKAREIIELCESSGHNLHLILAPLGKFPNVTKEKETVLSPVTSLYATSKAEGSYRYVYKDDSGQIVGAIQIMSKDGKKGIIVNAYVLPDHRGKMIGRLLIDAAKVKFSKLKHSDDLTPDGEKFAKKNPL